jgi:hypothetical protein
MIDIILVALLVILIVVGLLILYYVKKSKYRNKQRRSLLVPRRIAKYSRRVLRILCYKFNEYFKRYPNQNEVMRLIIMTSHIVIKGNTWPDHWLRWRIRMFLAAENHVWYGKKPSNNINLKQLGM